MIKQYSAMSQQWVLVMFCQVLVYDSSLARHFLPAILNNKL